MRLRPDKLNTGSQSSDSRNKHKGKKERVSNIIFEYIQSCTVYPQGITDKCFLSIRQLLCMQVWSKHRGRLILCMSHSCNLRFLGRFWAPGPAVNRDSEPFHTWIVWCHVGFFAHATVIVWVYIVILYFLSCTDLICVLYYSCFSFFFFPNWPPVWVSIWFVCLAKGYVSPWWL